MANIGVCGECEIGGRRCRKRQNVGSCLAAKRGTECGGVLRTLPKSEGKKTRMRVAPQEKPVRTICPVSKIHRLERPVRRGSIGSMGSQEAGGRRGGAGPWPMGYDY